MEKAPPLQPWTIPRMSETTIVKLRFCTCPLAGIVTKRSPNPSTSTKIPSHWLPQVGDSTWRMGDVWVNFDAQSWMFSGGSSILIVCSDVLLCWKQRNKYELNKCHKNIFANHIPCIQSFFAWNHPAKEIKATKYITWKPPTDHQYLLNEDFSNSMYHFFVSRCPVNWECRDIGSKFPHPNCLVPLHKNSPLKCRTMNLCPNVCTKTRKNGLPSLTCVAT